MKKAILIWVLLCAVAATATAQADIIKAPPPSARAKIAAHRKPDVQPLVVAHAPSKPVLAPIVVTITASPLELAQLAIDIEPLDTPELEQLAVALRLHTFATSSLEVQHEAVQGHFLPMAVSVESSVHSLAPVAITSGGGVLGGLGMLGVLGDAFTSPVLSPIALTLNAPRIKPTRPMRSTHTVDREGIKLALEAVSLSLTYEAEEGTAVYNEIRRGNRRAVETMLDGERQIREEGKRQRGEGTSRDSTFMNSNPTNPTNPSNPTQPTRRQVRTTN